MQDLINKSVENGNQPPRILKVVIYCASSPDIAQAYFEAAKELGALLAENKITSITGAGRQGLMGAVNESVLKNGGRVTGIIPQFMVDNGWYHPELTELIVTDNMHERKQAMVQRSDAAIALPGGLGTLEELAEILTWKQLDLYRKPIVILNVNGFYDPLIEMLEKMIRLNFMNAQYRDMWHVVQTPAEVIEVLNQNKIWEPGFAKYDKKEL